VTQPLRLKCEALVSKFAFTNGSTGYRYHEDPERTTTRLLDFLRFVKYKPEVDELTLRNGWISGEHEVGLCTLNQVDP
jgi:hypothetical protein